MAKRMVSSSQGGRTFSYRAGVRVRGTILACDAATGSDLIFLSHAQALDARAARLLPRPRAGKRQILTTETTLALLGTAGNRLRPHALAAAYGRPFNLGSMRLEVFPAGHVPGSASLLCDLGSRPLVYAGPLGAAQPDTADRPEIRTAQALCVDGTFAAPRFAFPPLADALVAVRERVRAALAGKRAPVILARPLGPALDIAATLAADGIALRAHRQVMVAAAAYRAAGLTVPPMLRFGGRLKAGEALLWPLEGRDAGILGTLTAPWFLLASGWAVDPAVVANLRVDQSIPLSTVAGFTSLLRYIEATGALEVAIRHAPDDQLCQTLQARGIDAYTLGPPQQIALF